MNSNNIDSSVKNRKKGRVTGFEQWGGYMAAKKMKLSSLFESKRLELVDDEACTQIFKGVSIFVNGYTDPSVEELKRLMLVHGGTFHYYYSSKTTHTIASNLPNSKIKKLKSQIVVTPNWITDSIKAGKLLPHQNYLLYTPEAIDQQYRLTNFLNSKATSNIESEDFGNKHSLTCNISEQTDEAFESDETYQKRVFEQANMHSDLNQMYCFNNGRGSVDSEVIEENYNHSACKSDSPLKMHCFSNVQNSSSFSNNNETNVNAQNCESTVLNKSGLAIRAGQPGFLSEFYSHSRLHFISTLGQEMKRYLQTKVADHNGCFPAREKLRITVKNINILSLDDDISFDQMSFNPIERGQTIIMHLDMDCFFVSVGLRKHPDLKGQPVAVTHSKGMRGGPQEGSNIHYEAAHYTHQSKEKVQSLMSTNIEVPNETCFEVPKISMYSKEYGSLSEIASCSYEAREAGVKNGMFLGAALRLCPNLKTIPYDFEGFLEVSRQLHDIVSSYTLDIESISCDELYIDCTELLQDTQVSALKFASILRSEIEEKTKCTASAGIGNNMLLARLANKYAKPNGQYYVTNVEADEFMMLQRVRDLPGVGKSISEKLKQFGIETCGDLKSWSLYRLQQEFGSKNGQTLFNYCRGKDDRKVQLQKERKSVSTEINYGIRFEMESEVFNFIGELANEVHKRLQNINSKGKSVTLKLMVRKSDAPTQTAKFMGHGVCDHISKSVLLKCATDDASVIGSESCKLARGLKVKPQDYRGIGIQVSRLEPAGKDTKSNKSIASFLCQNSETAISDFQKSTLSSAEHKVRDNLTPENVENHLPNKNTIKDFLSKKQFPQKKEISQGDHITLSQIDPDFLSALPENIRKEVLDTYSSHYTNIPTSPTLPTHSNMFINSNNASLEKPSCSRNLVLSRNKEKVNAKTNKQMACEIDSNVLNALPEHIQKEVLDTYGCHSMNIPTATTSTHNNLAEKSSCRRNLILSRNKIVNPYINKQIIPIKKTEDSKMQPDSDLEDTKVMTGLQGVEDINEIRSIIKEWIDNFEVALEEDVEHLKNYLVQYVKKDLKNVEVILRYFYRMVSSSNDTWKRTYQTIMEIVQQKVQDVYGGKLKLESYFFK